VKGNDKYLANDILRMVKEFNRKSQLFKQMGGVHSCAVCNDDGIVYFSYDIESVMPNIVSHSAQTDRTLDIVKKSNITMVGFARGNRMSIYCRIDRIVI
jgi:FdhD protein